MRRRFRLVTMALLLGSLGGIGSAWSQQPPAPGGSIRDLRHRFDAGEMYVSFRLEGAFTESVEEMLHSSQEYTFTHTVKLVRKRSFWFPKEIAKIRVSAEVSYDNLTKRYALKRKFDDVLIEDEETDSDEEMRRFMAEVIDLPLVKRSVLEGRKRATLRVSSDYESTSLFFFLPWSYTASAEQEISLRR